MRELTLQLPDEVLTRLQNEADRQQLAVTDLVQSVIEDYLDKELDDEDEDTDEEILKDFREAFRAVLAGDTGRLAREILDDIRRDSGYDADNGSRS